MAARHAVLHLPVCPCPYHSHADCATAQLTPIHAPAHAADSLSLPLQDNLKPISCVGEDWQGGLAITLLDSLDALLVRPGVCAARLACGRCVIGRALLIQNRKHVKRVRPAKQAFKDVVCMVW